MQSSTFSKSVLSCKFPPDTQNAMLTNKLEDFYQDSQFISVKGREHSSEHFPKKTSKNSFVVVEAILTNLKDSFNQKTKRFLINFRISRNYQFFWGKSNFLTKVSSVYVESIFGNSEEKFLPKIQKTLAGFSKSSIRIIFRLQKKYTSKKSSESSFIWNSTILIGKFFLSKTISFLKMLLWTGRMHLWPTHRMFFHTFWDC